MKYIAELKEDMVISEIYFCKKKQELLTKAGKTYFAVTLQDKTGTLDAKVWNTGSGGIEEFSSMDYVFVSGRITSFQGALQLNIDRVRKCREGEYNPADYMPMTDKNVAEMYQELLNTIKKMENPYLKKVSQIFFVEDGEFAKAFQYHSAAKSVHHGFIGGLLEHTVGVVRICEYMAQHYPLINRDLLVCAAMFHDMGKLEELSRFPENDYTDDGQLLGHIFIGAEKLGQAIATIPNFPRKLSSELRHCILAHHGELEYGSPKKPALIEALALSLADNMDAKMQTMSEALGNSLDTTEWLGYNRMFESNIRRSSK